MMPSMEKTPSVAMRRKRQSAASQQLGLQIRHVVVGVAQPLGLAEPHPVDDAGVVQGIGDDRVLRPQRVSKSPVLASKQEA